MNANAVDCTRVFLLSISPDQHLQRDTANYGVACAAGVDGVASQVLAAPRVASLIARVGLFIRKSFANFLLP